jgi:amidase
LKAEVHPECVRAVEDAARLLADLGHAVEEAEPAVDGIALAKSYFSMYFGEIAADIRDMRRILGRRITAADVEGPTWVLKLLGDVMSAGEFVLVIRQWNTFARQVGEFHARYDIFLTPTTAYPPARIGELKPKPAEEAAMKVVNRLGLGRLVKASGLAEKIAIESLAKTPFTQIANLTRLPAMSVPHHRTADTLPCGVQFIARFAEEPRCSAWQASWKRPGRGSTGAGALAGNLGASPGELSSAQVPIIITV